jgi:hypothetical protein
MEWNAQRILAFQRFSISEEAYASTTLTKSTLMCETRTKVRRANKASATASFDGNGMRGHWPTCRSGKVMEATVSLE